MTGFVLAGGRSSRMGCNKALLELDGEPLVARGLRTLGEFCAEVAIAGGVAELACYGRLLPERYAGAGPLSGMVAALEATSSEWNAVLAVDVPYVPLRAWLLLLARAQGSAAVAVLPCVDGREQPLCGLYRRACLPGMIAELEQGRGKVTAALDRVGTVLWLEFAEREWFVNVNTPEEFARLASLGRSGPIR